jgi:hypothetical protein
MSESSRAGSEPQLLHQTASGVFGLDEVIEDFDDADVERLRRIAAAIRTPPRDGVRSAIALAGSAAQSRFQRFPGDCDYFERVHITAPTREAALETLVGVMIETVARSFPRDDLQFVEMKLGLHDRDRRRGEELLRAGSPISWSLADVDARSIVVEEDDGSAVVIEMADAAHEPGFVKLDWVHADDERDRVVPVSKVIDATWEAPSGDVVALDGVLDSFYQEVYLDPESRPHVERLIDEVKPEGLGQYIAQLESEIRKYSDPAHANFGKVAKRLYNIFRLTNQAAPAAHLRGLFDDPPARLYQVPATLYALESALASRHLSTDVVSDQLAGLEAMLREHYAGDDLDDLVARLRALPQLDRAARAEAMEHISQRANTQVSDYFEAKLREDAEIVVYLESLAD